MDGGDVPARDLRTVPQIHDQTNIPIRTLYRWIKTGQLRASKIGTRYVVHVDDVPDVQRDTFGKPIPVDAVPELAS